MQYSTQDEIHDFFTASYPMSFIGFDQIANQNQSFISRIRYYHLFQDIIGRNSGLVFTALRVLEQCSLRLQSKLNIQRTQYVQPYKGANWFSITDALAKYVLDHESQIKKQFYYSNLAVPHKSKRSAPIDTKILTCNKTCLI